ncbi:polyketide cyclase [Segetibacter sp. 3557_3]|uniref:SRPBCC family protein n=1 Tax=Segetibacter sp. 3557_3 TaxID=2547429 RepID=UPI001058FA1A|nr:SRPBCC family protein [Segetibacter sp. 3557_3]TDH21261.1 polyketide cyclase [Segetibacter sp. 3557_3]
MKVFRKIVAVILILIAIPLVIALFVKKEYTVERELTINKPTEPVFEYIRHIKNQDHYSKWVMTDQAMNKQFKGTDGTVGFVYAWDSENKNAGKGEQEIKSITYGKQVDMEIRFIKPFEGIATTYMRTEPVTENQTKVKWAMKGQNNYPMNFMNLFIDGMLGKDMETSLATLKGILEKS